MLIVRQILISSSLSGISHSWAPTLCANTLIPSYYICKHTSHRTPFTATLAIGWQVFDLILLYYLLMTCLIYSSLSVDQTMTSCNVDTMFLMHCPTLIRVVTPTPTLSMLSYSQCNLTNRSTDFVYTYCIYGFSVSLCFDFIIRA